MVAELVGEGARAVVVTGSHARGEAREDSDLDLVVLGSGPRYRLEVIEGRLVAEKWTTEEECRARFSDPGSVGSHVPGWRDSIVLHDPEGLAERLKREALSWNWSLLGARCDAWVAEEVIGLAEEVEKVVGALGSGRTLRAAARRHVLALRLAPILAVHYRLLGGSEDALWHRLGVRIGPEWTQAQAVAFATGGERLEVSCAAALRLYRIAAESVTAILGERQRSVVGHALAIAAPHERAA
jgi:predicted nucleotidyltransferase